MILILKLLLTITLLYLNGCTLMLLIPHTYNSVDDISWERVTLKNQDVSIELPLDKDLKWAQWKESTFAGEAQRIFQVILQIVPHSIMEPRTFAQLNIWSVEDHAMSKSYDNYKDIIYQYARDENIEEGKIYKYYLPEADMIEYEYNSILNKTRIIKIGIELVRIKSIGSAFYRHDSAYPHYLEKIYKRILWSLEVDGKRIFPESSPEEIEIIAIKTEKIPAGYEELFEEFGL